MHRTVTVTADDFGLTRRATDAILDAADKGAVNQVSVIANGYAVDYALFEWGKRCDRLSLALHLNLTEGKALTPPHMLRIIAKDDGAFRYSPYGLLVRSLVPWRRRALMDELMLEASTQLAYVRDRVGAVPLSIDGHQHVQMIPAVMRIIRTFDERNPFRAVRITREPFFVPESGIFAYLGKRGIRHVGLNLLSSLVRSRAHAPQYFLGTLLSGEQTLGSLERALMASHQPGTLAVEIGLHPGTASLDEVAGWEGDQTWHTSFHRQEELALAKDERFASLLRAFTEGTLAGRGGTRGSVMRFLIAGSIATGTNLGLLYAFTDLLGIWYLLSMFLAYAIATVVGFVLQKFWAFSHHALERTHFELAVFIANNALGVAFDAVGLYFLVEYAGVWYLAAQFFLLAVIALSNFFVYRFLFTPRESL